MEKITIIIPAKDEEKRIRNTLEDYATNIPGAKILVVINGTTDKTETVVKKVSENFPQIEYIVYKEKIGKGGAIINGLKHAVKNSDFIGFTDADNSTNATEYNKLIKEIEKKDCDCVIASRRTKGAKILQKQPLTRRVSSLGFNLLIKALFFLPYNDTQCGAKLMTKKAVEKIIPKLGVTDWAFDIDLLYILKKNKLRIKETGINWSDSEGSKLNLKKTIIRMFLSIIRLRLIYSPLSKFSFPKNMASLIYHTMYDDIEKKPNTITIFLWKDLLHPQMGGSELYMFKQARYWKEKGFNIIFLTAQFNGCKTKENLEGHLVYRIGGRYTTYLLTPIFYLLKIRSLTNYVIDVENGIPYFTPLYSLKPKILCVYHVHKNIFFRELSPFIAWAPYLMESYLMPLVYIRTKVLTISQDTKSDLKKIGFDEKRITIVNPGVDIEKAVIGKKTNEPSACYLGRIEKYKRVDLIIDCFKKNKYKNSKLIIAGAGNELENIKKKIIKEGLSKRIEFKGFISEKEKYTLLTKSWILLQASEKEGWGICVIEANICNTPAISFNVPGLRESIVDKQNGLIVNNEKEYTAAIEKVFSKETRFSGLVEYGKKFSWEEAAKKTIRLITQR